MFDISSVILSNFRSFAGQHTFVLPTAPGLYLFTGVNKVNPRLGANGTGKSSLLEAMYWCLYGRTSRGLKSNDIVTWGAKQCSVEMKLNVAGQKLTVKRSQSPNSLTLNGRAVEQGELTATVCLSPEQFLVAVMMPQFGESFFDQSPAAKLALFTDIMGLDFWLNQSTDAAKLAKEISVEKADADRKINIGKGAIEELTASIADLNQKRDTFDAEQVRIIKKLTEDLKVHEAEAPKLQAALKRAELCLTGAQQRFVAARKALDQAGEEFEDLRMEQVAVSRGEGVVAEKLVTLHKAEKRMKDLGVECPSCRQKVPHQHVHAVLKELTAEIKGVHKEADKLAKSAPDLAPIRAKLQQLKQDLSTIEKNRDDFTRERQTLLNEWNRHVAIKGNMTVTLSEAHDRLNPFDEMLGKYGRLLTGRRLEGRELKKQADALANDLTATEFWVGGFKRVRLFLIESTLQQLEVEVNNNLSELGLGDWSIEFDVERENKSGGITKGFTVMIRSPGGGDAVPFAAWSGGESQRLRMAGDLGLANLIMERAGLENTIEMFDEPSKHLSQEGLNDLAETLAVRAEASGRRILLIDHNTMDFGGFANTITVIKDKNGSRLA